MFSKASLPKLLGKTPDTVLTKEGISIKLRKGSLVEEKADALFNSTRNNLNLATGALSAALLKAAGSCIQQECYNNKPNVFSAGDIVVTSGGNLPVKSIFHGFCRPWDKHQGKLDLETNTRNALKAAHSRKYESIAFPAFGTGNLNYPLDVLPQVLVDEVMSFSAEYPKTTLKDVRVVLYPLDQAVIKVFEDYWKLVTERQGECSATLHLEEIRYGIRKRGKYQVTKNVQPSVLHRVIHESKSKIVGQIEGMRIIVKEGDITKETTDVIMNSTDSYFNKGKVLNALVKAGGKHIEDEVKAKVPLQDVLMTDGGRLQCKKILHINIKATELDWDGLLLKAFSLVEDKGMRSLAMPAIGTGAFRMPASDMSDIILRAVAKFATTHKPVNFRELVIVLYDQLVFKEFKTQLSLILHGK